jgi:hypothetical protein
MRSDVHGMRGLGFRPQAVLARLWAALGRLRRRVGRSLALPEPTRDIAWSGTNAKQQARSNARSMRLLCDAGPYTLQVFLAIAICEFA